MEPTPLKEFLTDIALDPARLSAYMMDPEGAMAAAGLSTRDRQALQNADQHAIHARVIGRDGEDPSSAFEICHECTFFTFPK